MKKLPTHIALNLTSACNMDCPYCYMDTLNSGKRMSNQVIDSVIKMMDATDGQRFQVAFFGGEPTLASRSMNYIIDNVDIDKVEGFSLTTNGTNIDVVNQVAKRGFEVSDGRIRTNVLFSNKAQRAPHEDLNLTHVFCSYRYIVTTEALDEITSELIYELLDSKFNQVDFRFDYYANWSTVDQAELGRVLELLTTVAQTTRRFNFLSPAGVTPKVMKKCPAPHVSIDTNGDLLPCHRMFNATRGIGKAVGNVVEDFEGACANLSSFHDETHFSSSCIGFNKNVGQDDNVYLLTLGAKTYHELAENLTPDLQVAAEMQCR
jgi:sulfatase maturation enzyme AslB (radical SAM superfamily)